MPDPNVNAWRCGVCGYIHRGHETPEWCPVCGSSRGEFQSYVEEAPPAAKAKVERWRCTNCSYVHTGPEPPDTCPVCGSPTDRFEPLSEAAEAAAGAVEARKIVIVGAGIAGLAAVEALRGASPDTEITLISKEPELPYYRLNLTRYLAGEIDEETLPIHPEEWYADQNVQLLPNAEVSAISPDEGVVHLHGAERESFEKLILTMGALPFMPPFPGANRQGVTCFRTLDDAKRILQSSMAEGRCVCIGGGLLGLETAGALARRGADVTLLEGHGWLLPRQLNQTAGEMLGRHVQSVGIKLRKQTRTDEILGDERVRAVSLQDGTVIPADLAVIATGVRPNSYLARLAGLDVGEGVVVDNHLASSHPNVLAAGDVAEHRATLYGIWVASQAQGNIAGMNAAGLSAEFGGIPRSNTLKVLGLDLFSIGQVEPQDASFEVIEQESDGRYFQFIFRDTHLVGAILLGDTELTAPVKKAVESRTDFSGLLRKRATAADVLDRLRETADACVTTSASLTFHNEN